MKSEPTYNELPISYADRLGRQYAVSKSDDHKKEHGQYLTPAPVADYMASLITITPKNLIRVLDPGSGTGILSCAVLCKLAGTPNIELVVYEKDNQIIPLLGVYCQYWTESL